MIDTRGLSCPMPVMMVQKAVKAAPAELEVLLDSQTALLNVTRFAEGEGYYRKIVTTKAKCGESDNKSCQRRYKTSRENGNEKRVLNQRETILAQQKQTAIKEAEHTLRATGIVRRIDELGRVVIPKEIRRTMRIREGDPTLTSLTPVTRFLYAIMDISKRFGVDHEA